MSCTLVNRLRVRLTVPSLAKSAVAELCVSPPGVESSEPTLDTDDVLEREWEASESMAENGDKICLRTRGRKVSRGLRVPYLSLDSPSTRPRTQRVRVHHVSVFCPSSHVMDALLNLDRILRISST